MKTVMENFSAKKKKENTGDNQQSGQFQSSGIANKTSQETEINKDRFLYFSGKY